MMITSILVPYKEYMELKEIKGKYEVLTDEHTVLRESYNRLKSMMDVIQNTNKRLQEENKRLVKEEKKNKTNPEKERFKKTLTSTMKMMKEFEEDLDW